MELNDTAARAKMAVASYLKMREGKDISEDQIVCTNSANHDGNMWTHFCVVPEEMALFAVIHDTDAIETLVVRYKPIDSHTFTAYGDDVEISLQFLKGEPTQ